MKVLGRDKWPRSPQGADGIALSIGGDKLQRLNVFFFYDLGQALQRVEGVTPEGTPIKELIYPVVNAVGWLDSLLNAEAITLPVVRAPAVKLKSLLQDRERKCRQQISAAEVKVTRRRNRQN